MREAGRAGDQARQRHVRYVNGCRIDGVLERHEQEASDGLGRCEHDGGHQRTRTQDERPGPAQERTERAAGFVRRHVPAERLVQAEAAQGIEQCDHQQRDVE